MKLMNFGQVLAGTAALACTFALVAPRVEAAGWVYSWDSFNDGTGYRNQNGANPNSTTHGVGYQSDFEFFGMAVLEDLANDRVTFAFNTNLALTGWGSSPNIGMGDLFINLDPTKTFTQAEGTESLLAIRFAETNDSGLEGTGVFSHVVGQNVTQSNQGWKSYSDYEKYVTGKKGTVEYIDGMTNAEAKAYLGAHGESVVRAGTGVKLGDVSVITDVAVLAAMGLSFTAAAAEAGLSSPALGTQTYAVSFARSLLPAGELNWIAHIMAECANDIMGTTGTFAAIPPEKEDVPEPMALAAFALVGVGMIGARKRN